MGYSNTAQTVATEIAAEVVSDAVRMVGGAARGTVAGALVQPAVWAFTDTSPDAGDVFSYTVSTIGGIVGRAAGAAPGLVLGLFKALVDDTTAALVEEARQDEDPKYRPGIFGVGDRGFWASGNAQSCWAVAMSGGVAWQHPNGAYLFIRDGKGRMVCDFRPRVWTRRYTPKLPLRTAANGKIEWETRSR